MTLRDATREAMWDATREAMWDAMWIGECKNVGLLLVHEKDFHEMRST